ncbi:MAG: hypothetical protein ABIY70_15935 [Capsulimonas sp.]|uniref:hypothetical protein n=1 Tax=Capsulimonas sp. TaxID=2494211 RepID=UPI003267FCD2
MRPRRFYGYYFALSVGCIGAFCVWAHLPHRMTSRRHPVRQMRTIDTRPFNPSPDRPELLFTTR